jgi:gamma-glutamylcyclotransferase (GGCT)/AIG2-like uncharacterized protein YtfP
MTEEEAANLLFVYGTLLSGGGKESLLRDCRLLREATVRGTLFDLGRYPALVMGADSIVHGELWSCTAETLEALDSYEGVAEGLFERVRIALAGGGACWTYVAGPRVRSRLATASRLPAGLWTPPRGGGRDAASDDAVERPTGNARR